MIFCCYYDEKATSSMTSLLLLALHILLVAPDLRLIFLIYFFIWIINQRKLYDCWSQTQVLHFLSSIGYSVSQYLDMSIVCLSTRERISLHMNCIWKWVCVCLCLCVSVSVCLCFCVCVWLKEHFVFQCTNVNIHTHM